MPEVAIKFVIHNGGIEAEDSYPYNGQDLNTCKFNSSETGASFSAVKTLPWMNEQALQQAVALNGPVSVGIDASSSTFRFYKSGVYYSSWCSATDLNHGVLVAGYGTENKSDYWLVKNSWGYDWGLSGYIKMSRNLNNNCGIA